MHHRNTTSGNSFPKRCYRDYAYAIYDESGLIDVDVAGYPSTLSGTNVAYKNAIPYADLTQAGLTAPEVDALVNWRNATSLLVNGYTSYVLDNQTGFVTTSATALFPGSGFAALLDTFCINDSPCGLTEGKINLNTKSIPAIKAVLSGQGAESATGATPTRTRPLPPPPT